MIVEPINLREIRSADGSVTELIKKKKHSVKKEKKLILMQLESKLKTGRLIEVIAHEMVHVKQTVRGQLASKGVSLFWRGKKVLCSKINYYDRPWEIEAWSKQTLLSNKIFRLLDKQYEYILLNYIPLILNRNFLKCLMLAIKQGLASTAVICKHQSPCN